MYYINHSQNVKAVKPNRQNWLFYCPKSDKDKASPIIYAKFITNNKINLRPFMVWLILQNKPVGEYAKRYLLQPRVRPHRPSLGLLTQNVKGVFTMNANTIPLYFPFANFPILPIIWRTNNRPCVLGCAMIFNFSIDKPAQNGNNTATTKQIAVQPSRHSLAIFVLDLLARHATSQKTPYSGKSVYGGLIGVNKIPVTGNSPSRLFAVVETCQPIFLGWQILTKQIGVFTMNAKTISASILSNANHSIHTFLNYLSQLTPLERLTLGLILSFVSFCLTLSLLIVFGGAL